MMGATLEAIEQATREEWDAITCEVHADNVTTVAAFLALQTQWRYRPAGLGGAMVTGMDYAAIPATLHLLGVPRAERAEVFDGLRIMEGAALPVLHERVAAAAEGDDA